MEINVKTSSAEIKSIAQRIIGAINDAQNLDGHSLDKVISASLLTIGSVMAQRGISINEETLLKNISPLLDGYKNELAKGKH